MSAQQAEGETSPAGKQWVKFDEASENKEVETRVPVPSPRAEYSGAVIETETVHVDIDKVKQTQINRPAESTTRANLNTALRNVDLGDQSNGVSLPQLGVIRQGFANGDVIVTVLPVNQKWPWVTPALFRPELVPEELMAEGLTLTVEDYVQIMENLVHDVRFTVYNMCYKRLLMAWLATSFIVLLSLLFSGARGLTLFGCGVVWLIINAGAIFLCMWLKTKLNQSLERAVARANQSLVRHKILLGVDDRGKLSCHKINLCFIYFDTTDCVRKLQQVIENEENAQGAQQNAEDQRRIDSLRQRMDIDDSDIVVAGANPTRISRKQDKAERLLLRYSQRWAKDFLRHRLDWSVDESYSYNRQNPDVDPYPSANFPRPRHLSSALCACQYIEDYLRNKPRKDPRACCGFF